MRYVIDALKWRGIANEVRDLPGDSDAFWEQLQLALRAFKLTGDPAKWDNFAELPSEDRDLLSAWYETMLRLDAERALVAEAIAKPDQNLNKNLLH